nr:PREDICTED: uncharacterized protein LOC105662359 [Megachile rotundata]
MQEELLLSTPFRSLFPNPRLPGTVFLQRKPQTAFDHNALSTRRKRRSIPDSGLKTFLTLVVVTNLYLILHRACDLFFVIRDGLTIRVLRGEGTTEICHYPIYRTVQRTSSKATVSFECNQPHCHAFMHHTHIRVKVS